MEIKKGQTKAQRRRTLLLTLILVLAIIGVLAAIIPYVMNLVGDTSDDTYVTEAKSIYIIIDEKISDNNGAVPNVTEIDQFNNDIRELSRIDTVSVLFNEGPEDSNETYDYYVSWTSVNNKTVEAGISRDGDIKILSSRWKRHKNEQGNLFILYYA